MASKLHVAGEATGRQAASFVLGSVATLTVVLLFQYQMPEYSRSAASRAPVQLISGRWRDLPHCSNGTTPAPAPAPTEDRGAAAARGDSNTTAKPPPPPPPAAAAASPPLAADHLPSKDPEEELLSCSAVHAARGTDGYDGVVVWRQAGEFRGLAAAVARAATDDRTVIITCVNHAFAAPNSLLDLFLESFRVGDGTTELLRHVLIVAMDPTALARCREVHPHCYLYTMAGIDFTSEKFFLSEDYLELVWSKLKLQRRILQLGYNFLFTDVDIMWLRNPLKHVTVYADMAISSDVYMGDPDNMNSFPNTGFFYVKPNERTIAMTKEWHESRSRYPGMNEQPVFNRIKEEMVKRLRLKVQYLDTAYIAGFCSYGKDLGKVCTMHANCCVGLAPKLRDLRTVLHDWNNYTRMPHWARPAAKWTVPGACIH
ncbi:hypothetical protein GUJ93_ZPchr0003g18610 [Zizania palustris]|uniref:Nucleotide-diphospho-sugar transferase domain-containing protein n=1 Tax=Zizania palustris TaxID=103762 RepID=A0A8J5S6Z2_ZIZPA|nr:hypothetical protein GUJ93_ZPchr0003g18610 [Zizania palustris]